MSSNPALLPENTRPLTVLGLMSGTSVDSVDACLALFQTTAGKLRFEILDTYTHDIPDSLREGLLACMENKPVLLADLCRLNVSVGTLFAEAVHGFCQATGRSVDAIDLIGSHGQTIYHLPPTENSPGSTLQIGEPSVIAEKTGITTVADFRPRDMAAGGQGAPLVCFADELLLRTSEAGRCIQNIGGIANVTVLPPVGQGAPMAFDTGPGNMLIDGAMAHFFRKPYDEDGRIAASGQVNPVLLAKLMAHPYLSQPPPKTTGRELFGKAFLTEVLTTSGAILPPDLIATLTHYTAKTIADAYQRFVLPAVSVRDVIIGGGGYANRTMMDTLSMLLTALDPQIRVRPHEDFGIPGKYKEALAFALLAWATAEGIPNNIPSCTGASRPVVMGKVVPGVRGFYPVSVS